MVWDRGTGNEPMWCGTGGLAMSLCGVGQRGLCGVGQGDWQ